MGAARFSGSQAQQYRSWEAPNNLTFTGVTLVEDILGELAGVEFTDCDINLLGDNFTGDVI